MMANGEQVTGQQRTTTQAPTAVAAKDETPRPRLLLAVAPKDLGQAVAVGATVVYLSGFVVVTAYLGEFGMHDYSAFRMQYLVAGGLFSLIAGLFAYFVAYPFYTANEDTKRFTRHLRLVTGQEDRWAGLALVYTLITVLHGILLCTLVSGWILFPIHEQPKEFLYVFFALLFGGLLSAWALTSKLALDARPTAFVLVGIYRVLSIIAYVYVATGPFSQIFWYYYLTFVALSLFEVGRRVVSNATPLTIYFVVVVVMVFSAGSFGSRFYSRIRAGVGGGEPIPVQVLINEKDAPPELAHVLKRPDGSLTPLDLLAETDAELLLGLSQKEGRYGKLLRVKRELVQAVYMKDTRPWIPPR
jgi:hypothetical protein